MIMKLLHYGYDIAFTTFKLGDHRKVLFVHFSGFTDDDLKKLLLRGSSSLHSLDLSRSFGILSDRSLNAVGRNLSE